MSNRTHPRTEAKYKPTLHALHYWADRQKDKTNATPDELREARSVEIDPVGPLAWEKEINKAVKYGY